MLLNTPHILRLAAILSYNNVGQSYEHSSMDTTLRELWSERLVIKTINERGWVVTPAGRDAIQRAERGDYNVGIHRLRPTPIRVSNFIYKPRPGIHN